MLVLKRRRIAALAAGGLVVAGVVASSLTASGQTPPPIEATQPLFVRYGTLTINLTDRAGTYTLDLADNSQYPDVVETIQVGNPCAAIQPLTGGLLRVTPNPASSTSAADTVQIRNSAFGVNTGNTSCGSSSAAVIARSEQLKIALGPSIPTGVSVKSASLRMTQLRSGNLQVRLNTDTAVFSTTSITTSPQTVPVAPQTNFRSITLQSTSTSDNQGLSVSNGTSFELVTLDPNFEVAVNCGQKVTETGDAGEIADTAVFFRGENDPAKQGDVACAQVGVKLEIRPGEVYWDNAVVGVNNTVQKVNGTVAIDWAPIRVLNAGIPTQIDYDGDPTNGGFIDAPWCLSFSSSTVVVDGIAKVTFTAELPPYTGPGANTDGTAPWCLVSSAQVLDGTGSVNRTETFFGSGDPLTRTVR